MIKKFRKKPVVIEAVQWTGDNLREIQLWSGRHITRSGAELLIPTLEGTMRAMLRDWITKGIQGEFYPCKPDIFKETYEEVG